MFWVLILSVVFFFRSALLLCMTPNGFNRAVWMFKDPWKRVNDWYQLFSYPPLFVYFPSYKVMCHWVDMIIWQAYPTQVTFLINHLLKQAANLAQMCMLTSQSKGGVHENVNHWLSGAYAHRFCSVGPTMNNRYTLAVDWIGHNRWKICALTFTFWQLYEVSLNDDLWW